MEPWSTENMCCMLRVLEQPCQVRSGWPVPPPSPAHLLHVEVAAPSRVVAMLPFRKQVRVPGPCHRAGCKSTTKLLPPICQPGEAEAHQGGIIVLPPSPTYGSHGHCRQRSIGKSTAMCKLLVPGIMTKHGGDMWHVSLYRRTWKRSHLLWV